jgi:serpin B
MPKNTLIYLIKNAKDGPSSWTLLFLLMSSVLVCGCMSLPDDTGSEAVVENHLTDAEEMEDVEEMKDIEQMTDAGDMTNAEMIAIANNRFALDMYREVAGRDENVFFSPWSLNSALAMTYEGARGKTADEMRSVLHFSGNDSVRRQSFSSLDHRINANDSGYVLSTANALWVDYGFPLEGAYEDVVIDYYRATAKNLDFSGAPDGARQTINQWVEEKTAYKIKELVPPGYISPLTRLVLTNAIYFNGTWVNQFDGSLTDDEDFFTADGGTVSVPMMRQLDEYVQFDYLETRDMQMLQMPYEGGKLSMTILLPKGHDLASLEWLLSVEMLDQWRKDQEEGARVDVYIPKFKISADYFLKDNLTNMGMPTSFTEMADFSGICPGRDLFIDEVIHQAYVNVNEAGTEAAAATEVGIAECAPGLAEEVPVFRADHPFIFMILDEETGCILFLGRISDPSRG